MKEGLIPAKGVQETVIQCLIAYLTNHIPYFASNIKGVSDNLILKYSNFQIISCLLCVHSI